MGSEQLATGKRQGLRLYIQGIPPGPNARLHYFARARANREFADLVLLAFRWQGLHLRPDLPFARAHLICTLYHRTGRFQDPDNATACLKPVIDALKGIVIADDAPDVLTLEVRQERGAERGVGLEVIPLEPLGPLVAVKSQGTREKKGRS